MEYLVKPRLGIDSNRIGSSELTRGIKSRERIARSTLTGSTLAGRRPGSTLTGSNLTGSTLMGSTGPKERLRVCDGAWPQGWPGRDHGGER